MMNWQPNWRKLRRPAAGAVQEFIRCAIRQALWDLEERWTAEAYKQQPDSEDEVYLDPRVWERPSKRPAARRKP